MIKKIIDEQADLIAERYKKYVNDKKEEEISEEEAEKEAELIANKIFPNDEGVKKTYKKLLVMYIEAGKLGSWMFEKVHLNEDGKIYNIIKDDFTKWLDEYGGDRIVMINKTTRNITKKIIKKGILSGDSTESIVKKLSDDIKNYNKARAKTIAETEIHNSFMFSNYTSANVSGFKYKKWITCKDSAVRMSHRILDDKIVKIDEDFASGLAYPSDWRASPSETIRCRCICRYLMEKE